MKIGIFGGSFNPPHKMHYGIGKELLQKGYLDRIIYVPVGNRYQKPELLDDEMRYEMVQIMVENEEKMMVSRYELQENLISTYQTLDHFQRMYPSDEIFFILGTDLLKDLGSWRRPEYLLENYYFLVVLRNDDTREKIAKMYEEEDHIIITDVKSEELSSTFIRKQLKEGKSILSEIPEAVGHYILKNKLYQIEEGKKE